MGENVTEDIKTQLLVGVTIQKKRTFAEHFPVNVLEYWLGYKQNCIQDFRKDPRWRALQKQWTAYKSYLLLKNAQSKMFAGELVTSLIRSLHCFNPFYPADNYPFKVNNRNVRTRCEIYSKLIIKILEQRHWRRSGTFIVNFEHISHLVLVFPLLTLSR